MEMKRVIIKKGKVAPELDLRSPANRLLCGYCYFMCMCTAESHRYTKILTTTDEFVRTGEFRFLSMSDEGHPRYNKIVIDQSRTYPSDEVQWTSKARTVVEDPDTMKVIDEIRANNPEFDENSNNMVSVCYTEFLNILGFDEDRPSVIQTNLIKMCIIDDMRSVVTQNRITTYEPDWKLLDESFLSEYRKKMAGDDDGDID